MISIYNIFPSINGEVCNTGQGSLATFIRFAGCNLRCSWCDTEYALSDKSGTWMTVEQIITEVNKFGLRNITITGGEPLVQEEGFQLLIQELWRRRYNISVETNGSIPLPWVEGVVNWVYDIKPMSAGVGSIHPHPKSDEFKRFKEDDFIKFVISNREDYDDAVKFYKALVAANCRARYAFSPNTDQLDTNQLVTWMKESKLSDVVVNLQLHKIINLSEPK